MKTINYCEYKHSYCHALVGMTDNNKKVMNAIRFAALVKKDSSFTYNLIKKYVLDNPEVRWTDTEQSFRDDIRCFCLMEGNSAKAYYRCANAIKNAETVLVKVDADGELAE